MNIPKFTAEAALGKSKRTYTQILGPSASAIQGGGDLQVLLSQDEEGNPGEGDESADSEDQNDEGDETSDEAESEESMGEQESGDTEDEEADDLEGVA